MSKTKIWRAWCAKNRVHVLDDRIIIGNVVDGRPVYNSAFGATYTVFSAEDSTGTEFVYPEAAIAGAEAYIRELLARIESKEDLLSVVHAIISTARSVIVRTDSWMPLPEPPEGEE